MKRLIKISAYLCLGLIALFILISLAVQTPWFKNWLRGKIITQVNENIAGTVEFSHLGGSLFNNLEIKDLTIDLENRRVLYVERIFLQYRFPDFLGKQLSLQDARIENPQFSLWKKDDATWNVEALMLTPETEVPSADASSFDWPILVESIRIAAGALEIERQTANAVTLPTSVNDINLTMGISWIDDVLKATLSDLNFRTEKPDFAVRTIKSDINYDPNRLQAQDVEIRTDASRFSARADVRDFKNPIFDLVFSGAPVSLEEIRAFSPDLNLYGEPRINFSAAGPMENLAVTFGVRWGRGQADLSGVLSLKKSPYNYDLTGAVSNLDLEEITNDSSLASNVNLGFRLNGYVVSPDSIFANFSGRFENSVLMNTEIGPSVINCEVIPDSIKVDTRARIAGSKIGARGVYRPANSKSAFSVAGNVRQLDFGKFGYSENFTTDLNFNFDLACSGNEIRALTGKLGLLMLPSTVNGIQIDSAQINLNVTEDAFDLYDFELDSPLGLLRAKGLGSISTEYVDKLEVTADLKDFSLLTAFFPIDSLYGAGRFQADVSGPRDSLRIVTEFLLDSAGMSDMTFAKLAVMGMGVITNEGYDFDVTGSLDSAYVYGAVVDTVTFNLALNDTATAFQTALRTPDDLRVKLVGLLKNVPEGQVVQLTELDVDYLKYAWRKKDTPIVIKLQENDIEFVGLELVSNDETILLGGLLNLNGDNRLNLGVKNLDIARYQNLLQSEMDLKGVLDIDISLNGSMAKPVIEGDLELKNGQYFSVSFQRFASSFSLRDDLLNWQCNLTKTETDSLLYASAKVPVIFKLSPFEQQVLADEPFEMKFSTRGLDISFLQVFDTGLRNLQGLLAADVVFSNTLNDLRGVGPIRLINGEFGIPELGTNYKKINVVLLLDQKELELLKLDVRSGSGSIKLLEGSLSLSEKGLEDFDSKFRVKNFELVNNKQMKARAQGIVELAGSIQSPYLIGDLTIDQARINYQTFEEKTAVNLTSQPFFVISDTVGFDTTGAVRFQKGKGTEEQLFTESEFYKNLTGELTFFFPRNVWIRSQDTNIEIRGDVVAVKEGEGFVLFGSVSTIRGFYSLFGNRFQIQKGEIVFNGDPEMNANVAIEAATTVTEEGLDGKPEKHEFMVNISGTLFYPEFQFLLDNEVANQEDVISILLFGQRFESVKSKATSAGGADSQIALDDRARGLLTGQLIKQLSNRVGQQLRLDVIQIESGDDPKIKVGKYVTPEVFVSVSQDFGEQNPLVELEYEIPRKILFFNLLLQASRDKEGTTGLDVIWKIDW